jgi:hypothetical protein
VGDQIGDEPRDRVERVLDGRNKQDLGADVRVQGAFERRAIFRIGLNREDPAEWFGVGVLGHGDRVADVGSACPAGRLGPSDKQVRSRSSARKS